MKVHLTKKELLNLISRALGETIEDVVIIKGPTKLYENIIKSYREQELLDVLGNIFPDKKIAAIKHYRSLHNGCSLAESKYLIEHWSEYLQFIKTNKREPELVHSGDWYFEMK